MKELNLILVNYSSKFSESILEECEKIKHLKYILLLDTEKPKKKYSFNIDYLNIQELHYANYEISITDFKPVSNQEIEKYTKIEPVIMKMLDRGNKPSKLIQYHLKSQKDFQSSFFSYRAELSYDLRKIIYRRHLRFWINIIKEKNINFYYSCIVPHIVYDLISYYVCKENNIPCLFNTFTGYPGTLLPVKSIFNNFESIKNDYKKNIIKYKNKNVKLSTSGEDFLLGKKKKMAPYWANEKATEWTTYPKKFENNIIFLSKILYSLIRFKKDLLSFYLIQRLYERSFFKKINDYRSYLTKETHKKIPKEKYVYFPLHLEPECSTVPLGGLNYDQLRVIDSLAYYAKQHNFLVVIKEHPAQKSIGRCFEFYEEIIKNTNVRFIDTKTDSFNLILKSEFIATITGSSGFEALYWGKPVMCFGETILKAAPSVFNPKNEKDFNFFFKNYHKFFCSNKNLRIFFKTLEENSISAFIDHFEFMGIDMFKKFGLTPKSISKNLIDNLKKHLKENN